MCAVQGLLFIVIPDFAQSLFPAIYKVSSRKMNSIWIKYLQ
jgi:hypothetical protein